MRFKSVCKRWHSLPTNPSFIASHLKHINTPSRLASWNGNNSGLIVRHDGFHVFAVSGPRRVNLQPVNLTFGFDRKPDLVLGPCDGVFCLYWRPTAHLFGFGSSPHVKRLPTIALWNPATRAFCILPMSKFDFPPYKKVSDCIVGFGFDLTTSSMKVVKVVSFCRDEANKYNRINCVEVYDLGSGSWRVLQVDDIVQEVVVCDSPTSSMYNNNDGVFHWRLWRINRGIDSFVNYVELVLSFDMSRELFHVTLMPDNFVNRARNNIWVDCNFSLLRDSLAVNFTFIIEGHTTVALWVMKKDFDREAEAGESFSSYSWSHELTVELSRRGIFMGFWNKNELLMWTREPWMGKPFLYDLVTEQFRDLQLSGEPNFLYKESLVSVKGGCGNDSILYNQFTHK